MHGTGVFTRGEVLSFSCVNVELHFPVFCTAFLHATWREIALKIPGPTNLVRNSMRLPGMNSTSSADQIVMSHAASLGK